MDTSKVALQAGEYTQNTQKLVIDGTRDTEKNKGNENTHPPHISIEKALESALLV